MRHVEKLMLTISRHTEWMNKTHCHRDKQQHRSFRVRRTKDYLKNQI